MTNGQILVYFPHFNFQENAHKRLTIRKPHNFRVGKKIFPFMYFFSNLIKNELKKYIKDYFHIKVFNFKYFERISFKYSVYRENTL